MSKKGDYGVLVDATLVSGPEEERARRKLEELRQEGKDAVLVKKEEDRWELIDE